MLRSRTTALADSVVIFLLAAALIWPLFRLHYMDNWASIESTFIADGRFLKEHAQHPRWQPLWYCGTRFDYIYPPALRYGTAGIAELFSIDTARSYHLYTAIFYCLGFVGVYLLVRTSSDSRAAAWLASAAAAMLSPSFLFLKHIREDAAAAWLLPQRLNALARYGEGPHMTAFALLSFALAASWLGLRPGRRLSLALAAVLSALVVSNNFYGATALAILFPPLVWSLWITHRDHLIWLRAAAIAALAYGLTAFWLVPSYVEVTMRNMKLVSEPGNAWSAPLALVVAAAFALVTAKLAHRPQHAYPVFLAGALTFLGLNVLGRYYFNFRVSGEPDRLVPELDLILILGAVECLRRLWALRLPRLPAWLPKTCAVLLALAAFLPARNYVRHAWSIIPADLNYEQRIEWRLTGWIARNLPGVRSLATGSVRFWYNAWHDLPQVGGGSEQGVLNQNIVPGFFDVLAGRDPHVSVLWLQALGTGAVIVHDRRSTEIYHDYSYPEKFAGLLPVLYDSGEGDTIYGVPRRFSALARVVEATRIRAIQPIVVGGSLDQLRAYVAAVEDGPDSEAEWLRETTDRLRIRATLLPGQALLVQENYDPFWKASIAGRPVPVRKDPLGFMLLEAPAGAHEVLLVFELPLENFMGRIATALSVVVIAALLLTGLSRKESAS